MSIVKKEKVYKVNVEYKVQGVLHIEAIDRDTALEMAKNNCTAIIGFTTTIAPDKIEYSIPSAPQKKIV